MKKFAFIDVVTTTSFGGVQTGVWNFAAEFAREGHEVTVVAGKGDQKVSMVPGVKISTFPFIRRKRFPDLCRSFAFPKLAERVSFAVAGPAWNCLRRAGFDWALLHKPLDFFWPWLPGIPGTTKFALMSGGTDFMPFDRVLARKVKGLFGCSNFNARQLSNHFNREVETAYYGVDTTKFSPNKERAYWRGKFSGGKRDIFFGFAGRLIAWKGIDFVIRALAMEPLKGLPVRLLLVGDGPVRRELEQQAETLGVASQVSFLGPLDHESLPHFYSACDVGVFPSVGDEAFGITIAEAMSCGLPVIGSKKGGIPEVIGADELCGFLVEPSDPTALAARMRELALSPARRVELGGRARRRIVENFTWRRAARRLLGLLSEIDGDHALS